jgi:hypothetical protein
MAHVVVIDQSGRVEETHRDTVLAFANGFSYSILIPSTVKQRCIQRLRIRYNRLQEPYLKMFIAGLVILLKKFTHKLSTIIIDNEFDGKQGIIKGVLLNHLRELEPDFPKDSIIFTSIGKSSVAHHKAYDTFVKRIKPNYIVSEAELMKYLEK